MSRRRLLVCWMSGRLFALAFTLMLIVLGIVNVIFLHQKGSIASSPPIPVAPLPASPLKARSNVTALAARGRSSTTRQKKNKKFYLLPMPEITTWLAGNYTEEAKDFYESSLNEQQAEIWLHRSFERMTYQEGRTDDPNEANVILISGYLHLSAHLLKQQSKLPNRSNTTFIPLPTDDWIKLLSSRLQRIHGSKPHILLVPTWNPKVARNIGIAALMRSLKVARINVWSLGLERNTYWQHLPPERILPVPYVVTPSVDTKDELTASLEQSHRTNNLVFYAGDHRKHSVAWSGCNRSMVSPLMERTDMDVRLAYENTDRLSQREYHAHMQQAEYCLILCGDTPTSRSLASAMVSGCIPVRVGSRWEGRCDEPCKEGWGWTVSGESYPHLPYTDRIDWNIFPQVDEAEFAKQPAAVLEDMFASVDAKRKEEIRAVMRNVQLGWLYGFGNPVDSTALGDVASYTWSSIVSSIWKQRQ